MITILADSLDMANDAADSSLLSQGFEARQQYPTQPQDACFSLLVLQDQSP